MLTILIMHTMYTLRTVHTVVTSSRSPAVLVRRRARSSIMRWKGLVAEIPCREQDFIAKDRAGLEAAEAESDGEPIEE